MKLLEKHFEIALETPDGITRLRELILKLAMQGKLVEQNLKEQSAYELIEDIKKERQKLIKLGKIRKQKELELIKNDDTLYQLPSNWKWVRLNDFGTWKSGSTPNRSNSSFYDGNIPWVKSGEVKQGLIKETSESISELALKKCSLDLNPRGSVLVAMYGANIGEVGILDIEATTNQAVCACNTFSLINNKYLFNLISSLKQNFISQGAGAAQPNISREKIINTIVPLPPFEEQKRIVEKIEQLMFLCDKLEKQRDSKNDLLSKINNSAINKLVTSYDEKSLNKAWDFLYTNFNSIYTSKGNVESIKNIVLDLAFTGKFVNKKLKLNPSNAKDLLIEINDEKERLIKLKKYRKQDELLEINQEKLDYHLPTGWTYCRIKDIGFVLGGKRLPKGHDYSEIPTKYRYLTVTNMKNNSIVNNNVKYIDQNTREVIKQYVINKEDIYITIAGTIGAVGEIPEEFDDMNLTENACKLVFFKCDKQFLIYLFSSNVIKLQFDKLTNKLAQPKLSIRSILNTIIPLPPIEEQIFIVEKTKQLFSLIDKLEKNIEQSSKKQSQILNAVLAQV